MWGCFLNTYICINLIELTSRANNLWFSRHLCALTVISQNYCRCFNKLRNIGAGTELLTRNLQG